MKSTETTDFYYIDHHESPNDYSQLSDNELDLAYQLSKAFDMKDSRAIIQLIRFGAPVNWRLNYGLSLKEESPFVACVFYLLGGVSGLEVLRQNAQKICQNGQSADELFNYIKESVEIFEIFHEPGANTVPVPANKAFIQAIKSHAQHLRADPDHENGSLIIATSFRDPQLLRDMIEENNVINEPDSNGAHVNFMGYFNVNAIVWSAIMLDEESLIVLLESDSIVANNGLFHCSLLHWIVCAACLPWPQLMKDEKVDVALRMIERLSAYPQVNHASAIGWYPVDYATDVRVKDTLDQFFPRPMMSSTYRENMTATFQSAPNPNTAIVGARYDNT